MESPIRSRSSLTWSSRRTLIGTWSLRGTNQTSQTTATKPDVPKGSFKGPLGLTTLHEPPGGTAIADIVFVHGLNGGSQSTWSKGNVSSLYWPREWLPNDPAFEDVRIHAFGYPAGLGKAILGVEDFARTLLAEVKDSPSINQNGGNAHLIFVAHSMGGLVVKMAYILGRTEPQFRAVVDRISTIFFLATPHRGSTLAQTLSRVVTMVMGTRPHVDDLIPQSTTLRSIDEDFPSLCASIDILSFYETRPMSVGFVKTLIVDKSSAVMNLSNERRTPLDADHRNAAMFASQKDPSYLSIRKALAAVVSSLRETNQKRSRSDSHEDLTSVNHFLGVSAAPEDDLMTMDFARLPGSCEWLAHKDYYRSWRSISTRFLWLQGRPGTGKSFLAAHTILSLREAGVDCCYFFFQRGDATKSTIGACLRSLARQMATLHADVFAGIKKLASEAKDGPVEQNDDNSVFRKIFLSALLKIRPSRHQFWVIDAIDQCNSAEAVNFLVRIQEDWPVSILVTSRTGTESQRGVNRSKVYIRTETISEEDVQGDISLFLSSSMDLLPIAVSLEHPDSADMVAKITKKAGGSFLWASIVCSELQEACTEGEIRQVLDGMPPNMDSLYAQILSNMSKARFGKALATSILTWTANSFRALSTAEIKCPIEMDIKDKVDNIERAITKCCGQLVYVDTHSRVNLVHSTAREFLAQNSIESEFVVAKTEAHRRLGLICLEYILQSHEQSTRQLALATNADPRSSQLEHFPFMSYASAFLFHHLGLVPRVDDKMYTLLGRFFSSDAILGWIEIIAMTGDLQPVYHAGQVLNLLLSRVSRDLGALDDGDRAHKKLAMLDNWGDDLMHIATKFSSHLRQSPQSIHLLIPPFCPPDSSIHKQFASGFASIKVDGILAPAWDDCLSTVTYASGKKANFVAAGQGFFAVGMMNGSVILYDDLVFQEVLTLSHGEPVWKMAFAQDGSLLATAGAKRVRIWDTREGKEVSGFSIPSVCLALEFCENNAVLRAASKKNQLYEWDVKARQFCRERPIDWTTHLDEAYQLREPMLAAISPATSLLAVVYRGQEVVIWDPRRGRVHGIYDEETGSKRYVSAKGFSGGVPEPVRAIAFGDAIDTTLLAATYSIGDVHVYDTDSGVATAASQGVNSMVLAGSPDGRTLAGADSDGNLTLFDFKTLQPLYQIQLDTKLSPKGLVFSADSRRLLELRGNQCRLWEPTVLMRQDEPDVEHSDSASAVSTITPAISSAKRDESRIMAITCSSALPLVFCGRDDGSVWAYDISGETRMQRLFEQTATCGVNHLALDDTDRPLVLACGDLAGRVTVRKVDRTGGKGNANATWVVEDGPVSEVRCTSTGVLRQLLLSASRQRLLVVTADACMLWSLPPTTDGVQCLAHIDEPSGPVWASGPTNSGILLRAGPEGFRVYKWESLELIRTLPCSYTGTIDRVIALSHPRVLVSISRDAPATVLSKTTLGDWIQSWDLRKLLEGNTESPVEPAMEVSAHSAGIDSILGSFGTRLVVSTSGNWVSSLNIESAPTVSSEGRPDMASLVHHFFIPNDWISTLNKAMLGIGYGGEVLFARQPELAVIRRGLEVVGDTGASFNPRRPSLQQGQGRGGRSLLARSGGSRGTSFRGRSVSPMS
ncbi:hypothetical protein RB601_008177 [Gaeumannomyces tritici]